MRRVGGPLGALAALLVLAGSATPAAAATVAAGAEELELGGPPVIFTAAAGEANELTVSSIGGEPETVVFRDLGAPIVPGQGCAAEADGSVVCRVAGLAGIRVLLGDGDDRLDAAALRDQNRPPSPAASNFFAVEVDGGDGADDLVGADASFSCLSGGGGDDAITSAVTRAAPERAVCGPIGGEGDDRLDGGPTGETFSGGPGVDTISAGAGEDFAAGGSDGDLVDLGRGRDAGTGGAGADRIVGGLGDDTLRDSGGADAILGGDGDDLIEVDFRAAAGRDELRGGAGFDAVSYTCPSCRVSLNARADDGNRGDDRNDNVVLIEKVIANSIRYDVVAEANVSIGRGDDVLSGDRRANLLDGTRGPDLITGAGGSDRLIGGPGPDRLRAADGERDIVSCGGGADVAAVDREDSTSGCERVRVGRGSPRASRGGESR